MRCGWTLILFVWLWPGGAAADLVTEWHAYKSRFVAPEGRVLDSGNGGVSHSEGQAFGMLIACAAGDRPGFDALWTWTREHLRVRPDALAAWRWVPGSGVTDRNNATDGDLLLAWALLRAARTWGDAKLEQEALMIARDLRRRTVRITDHGTVLLPGTEGFEHDGVVTVNLSYWVFPALQALAVADPDPAWQALLDSGLSLLDAARFGRWGLPPDWLVLTDPVAPATGFPPRYGYDAVRIPLYLYWAGLDTPGRTAPFQALSAFFHGAPFLPPWVDLRNDSVSTHDASLGIHAIYLLVDSKPDASFPLLGGETDYYSASLLLLAKLARLEKTTP